MSEIEEKIAELEVEIVRCNERIDDLKRTREVAIAKLEAYRDALSLMPAKSVGRKTSTKRRKRKLSEQWQQILAAMTATLPLSVDYEAIENYASEHLNTTIDRRTLRSQMSLYKDRGLVEGDADDGFRVTAAGAEAAKAKELYDQIMEEGSEEKNSEPSNDSGGSKVQAVGYPPGAPEGSSLSTSTVTSTNFSKDELDDEVPF